MRAVIAAAQIALEEPTRDCPLCPRLVAYRTANRKKEPDWFNAPVPSFGERNARLLVVGLIKYGFAKGKFEARIDDGLKLVDCRITNAVRCVPPENKPTPEEAKTCRPFLHATLEGMKDLKAIVALGRIAHEATLRAFEQKLSDHPFAHGARHTLPRDIALFDSFHCSRYNTNTGRLTAPMFESVFAAVRAELK